MQDLIMDDGCWNLDDIREGEFDQLAIYRVPDQQVEKDDSRNRAQASLPRNLALRASKANHGVSPLSTNFHPNICLTKSHNPAL